MATSIGQYRKFVETHVEMPRGSCKYLIRDYGSYRTISKIILTDRDVNAAKKVDEYVFWTANPERIK